MDARHGIMDGDRPGLDNEGLNTLLQHCKRRKFRAGAIILHDNGPSDALYYILKGQVSVQTRRRLSGQVLVLTFLTAGEFVGELGLFYRCRGGNALVQARTSCEVAEISYQRFRWVSIHRPDILACMTCQMAERLRESNRRLAELVFDGTAARVAKTLLQLSRNIDAIRVQQGTRIRITRRELAQIIGASREQVSRCLSELAAQDIIILQGRHIIIPDGTH